MSNSGDGFQPKARSFIFKCCFPCIRRNHKLGETKEKETQKRSIAYKTNWQDECWLQNIAMDNIHRSGGQRCAKLGGKQGSYQKAFRWGDDLGAIITMSGWLARSDSEQVTDCDFRRELRFGR